MSRSKSQRRSMLAIFSRSICIRILCPSLFKISVKSLFPTLAELSPSSTTLNILFEDIFRIFQYLSRKYICACCFRLARSTYHVSQAISRVKEVTLESKLIGDAINLPSVDVDRRACNIFSNWILLLISQLRKRVARIYVTFILHREAAALYFLRPGCRNFHNFEEIKTFMALQWTFFF